MASSIGPGGRAQNRGPITDYDPDDKSIAAEFFELAELAYPSNTSLDLPYADLVAWVLSRDRFGTKKLCHVPVRALVPLRSFPNPGLFLLVGLTVCRPANALPKQEATCVACSRRCSGFGQIG